MDINLNAVLDRTGYGVVGINTVVNLELLGHETALWPSGPVEAPEKHHSTIRSALNRVERYNPLAPSLRISHAHDLARHVGKSCHCGMPIFELTRFLPIELHNMHSQDLLFVASRWAERVLIDNGIPPERLRVVPFGVDQDIFPFTERIRSGPTVFLNVGKWEVRKGHDVLAEAFNKAFAKSDDVRLVLLTHNASCSEDESRAWADVYRTSPLGAKVQIYESSLPSQRDVAEVMASADCGVFPFRAEGWNLDLAEMMAMGKNVIATNYSAPTEYLTPQNARLIKIDGLEDAADGKWFHGEGQWAEFGDAQVEQLVEHLRMVHRLKQTGELRPNLLGHSTMARFTWAAAAHHIATALAI